MLNIGRIITELPAPYGDVNFYDREPRWRIPEHVHRHHQILLVTRGGLTVETAREHRGSPDGERTSEELSRGDVSVVPAGFPHRLESPAGYAQFGINLRANGSNDAGTDASAADGLIAAVDAAFDRPFTLRGSPILDLLPEIEDADRRDTAVSRLVLRNLLDRALLLCVECRQKQRGDGAFKERMLRELEADPARAMNLETLADRLALSPTHLERLCRRYFSCGAITLMNRLKMGRARVWLAATELTIGEISDRLGFPDQSYFTRAFKRHYGTTPSGFRAERYE